MTNREMVARSLAAVWHPCTQMKSHERFPLVPVARASGAWLEDFEGRRYLDAVSSWWVNLFGHAHPAINAALREQMDTLEHAMLAGFTHAPAIELAERLAAIAPGTLGHAFFASDGASATEIALKMAAHYWANRGRPEKNRFASLQGGYHGETAGALGVTDVPIFRAAYSALVRGSIVAPFPARSADDHRFGGIRGAIDAADALGKILSERHSEIAAFIVEPLVQGASGMRFHHPEYLRRARELCTRHEVLFVADEIMTGFGRTGTMFACEQAAIAPDLLCLSKGITGGYLPLSCVLATDDLYAAFYDEEVARGFLHSHSYTGNPLACRAACAVLDLFERDDVLAANERKAARFVARADALAHHRSVRDFRHLGMIWAFEVESDEPAFAARAFEIALECGVLLRPIGRTVYFMPPYIVDEAEFGLMVDAGVAIADRLGRAA
ncbi:MAG TPA: adenosylmethionine--8-amino-7-oxononanoate transaminase [Usitatibacter sp.]|jgi:adenosylmethionine-8-amino-7-oxononanoate aminotransferase|nr:adenosylmethionine--8-amino-7-oxononanoate transaminase [Usitatibacter sp.]